ncbi:MAG: GTP-binding protein [Clostridia bacterium]|nr:GTP-binding protein [Clostridia bacterium]
MTKIDIISGFLGAGKTTLIKKLISEAFKGEKIVLIENEFGEIGIDGGFLKDAGIEITEMNSGCICCSLVGDFGEALKKVLAEFSPDRIIIEPSGVGKLSDVIKAVIDINSEDIKLNSFTTVADAKKSKMYMKNFGEFFNNQVEFAKSVVLSHTKGLSAEKLEEAVELIRSKNEKATLITTDWEELSGNDILNAMEQKDTLTESLADLLTIEKEHHHHHHEHHHHEHEHHHHEHEHHHHDHEEHDENCTCGCHDHGHHHHHADEVFTSYGKETTKSYTIEQIENALKALQDEEKYGIILRAKGIVNGENGKWIHFDYVPGEPDVRYGSAAVIGRICVIGSKINEEEIEKLF